VKLVNAGFAALLILPILAKKQMHMHRENSEAVKMWFEALSAGRGSFV